MTVEIKSLVRETPGLGEILEEVLRRVEQNDGRLPNQVTVRATSAVAGALGDLISPRFVRKVGPDRVQLSLGSYVRDRGPDTGDHLVDTLYAATGRVPRSVVEDDRRHRRTLERGLMSLELDAATIPSLEFLQAQRQGLGDHEPSPLVIHSREQGTDAALTLVQTVIRCVDGVLAVREPLRAPAFASRVLGNSKVLRRNGELYRWVADALITYDPRTEQRLDDAGVQPSEYRANALDVNGVLFDEAAASVLCFGPLVYSKQQERFDHVARHSALGESNRLVLQQLRGMHVERPPADRITIFENLTPYLDYVDKCALARRKDEIVVCCSGQANYAVIELLRHLAPYSIFARHSGDLDRTGVLILRSLILRTGMSIVPAWMDVATHNRFLGRGLPLSAEEKVRLGKRIRVDSADSLGHELLCAIASSNQWIEQEIYSDELIHALW